MRIVWRGFCGYCGRGASAAHLPRPPPRLLSLCCLLPRSCGSACNNLGWSALLVYGNNRMDFSWSRGHVSAKIGRPVWSPGSWLDEMEGRKGPKKSKIVSVSRHLSKIVSYFEQNSMQLCQILSNIVSANIRFYSYLCNEDEDKSNAAVRLPT